MTTYLFIGLILLLAAYLVRARRTRPGDDPSSAPARRRPPLRPPKKTARPGPQPAMARAEAAAAAPAAREPLTAPRPAPALAEPALSWTPEETIVEPGWPLPGEIAGGWSAPPAPPAMATFPEAVAPPVAVLEWEPTAQAGAPEGAGDPVHPAADLPAAEEWAMPPFDAAPPGDAPSGPPLWVPGETEVEAPPSVDADSDRPLWRGPPESVAVAAEESAAAFAAPPAPIEAPPVIAWGPADEMPGPAADDAPAAEGLVWADDSPPPPVQEPVPISWEAAAPEAPPVEAVAEPLPEPLPEPSMAVEPMAAVEPGPVVAIALPPSPESEPIAAVSWEASPGTDEAGPSIASIASFGTLTPAPVWPPESPPAPFLPTEAPVAEEAWAPVPPAVPSPHVAEEPWTPPPAPVPAPQVEAAIPFTRVCDRLGVTPRMLVLLRMLAQTPRSVSEQARALGVSRPLVADLCTRLENAGLVRREPVPTDRRRVRITLTDAGRRLCDETAGTPGSESLEAVVGRLSPAERARLLSSLQARGEH